MATIKDVAKLAGVSHGTVSNVLKGVNTVSIENIKKVEEAIAELGYKPNASAQLLKSNTSNSIYFVLPNITENFYSQLYTLANKQLLREGFTVSVFTTNDQILAEEEILKNLIGSNPSCIVVSTCQPENTTFFNSLLSNGTPIIFIEREPTQLDCNYVGFDNYSCLYNLVSRLLKEGKNNIALICGSSNYSNEQQCVDGYTSAYKKLDHKFDPNYIRYVYGNRLNVFSSVAHLFSLPTPPDAIICSKVELATSTYIAAHYMSDKPFDEIYSLYEDEKKDLQYPMIHKYLRSSLDITTSLLDMISEVTKNPSFSEKKKIYVSNIGAPEFTLPLFNTNKKSSTKSITAITMEGEVSDSIKSLLPSFTRNTGINVKIKAYPHEALHQIISSESQKSDSDIFMVDVLWLHEMSKKNYLLNLTNLIDQEFLDTINVDTNFFESLGKYNDNIYTIPYQYCCQLLFYRKDLFENYLINRQFFEQYKTELKPPENWTEFNAVARFFTRKYNADSPTKYGTTLGGRFSSAICTEFLSRLWSYGANVFNQNGEISLNSTNAIKALTNYAESYLYASKSSSENWWYEQVREFSQGDTAMMIMFANYTTSLFDHNNSRIMEKIGFSRIPGNTPVLGGWSLGVNNNSTRINESLQFIKWTCGKDLMLPHMLLGSQTACKALYSNSFALDIYPWLSKTYELFPTCRTRDIPDACENIKIKDVEETLAKAARECILDGISPQEAIQSASDHLIHLQS